MKALLYVIAGGIGVGLLLPSGRPGDANADAAAVIPSSAPKKSEASWSGQTILDRSPGGHFYVDGEVNGQLVRMMVDTGASIVALTTRDAERLGIEFDPSQFEIVGSGASGPVRGMRITLDSVSVEGKEVRNVRGSILEGLDITLLGQTYLSQLSSVSMSKDKMIIE
jgi:aspartyl protease family protein